jgi:hypothetical protein
MENGKLKMVSGKLKMEKVSAYKFLNTTDNSKSQD